MPFLRKKRRSTVGAPTRSELGHSLSLPDLTTPLIDEASWEELPAFAKFFPQLSNTIGKGNGATVKQHTIGIVTAGQPAQDAYAYDDFGAPTSTLPGVSGVSREPVTPRQSATIGHGAVASTTGYTYASPSRNRSPSLISAKGGPGSPIAFHRPFRGDNVFSPPQTAPPAPGPGHGFRHGADFRKSAAGWSMHGRGIGEEGDGYSTIGSMRPTSMAPGRKKRGKGKVVQERLNVIVAGGRGSGKTSLIRLLSSEPPSEPINSPLTSHAAGPATTVAPPSFSPDQTPSSPTSAGPPLPSLASPLVPSKRLSAALLRLTELAPTRSLTAHQVLIQQPRLQCALAVRFIDTPGLDVQTDDGPAVHAYIRERGVMALLGMVEGQCEAVLREESKVLRKGTAGADELVHLCLYLIDARRVLHSDTQAIEPDWGFQGLFVSDEDPLSRIKSAETEATPRPISTVDVKPRIPEADMQTIRSLRKRVTVLPILTYSDTLSTVELARARDAVRRDMAAAFANEEGGGFGLFGVSDDVAEPESPLAVTCPEGPHDPPTPALTDSSIVAEQDMPYALFCPSGMSASAPSAPVHGLGLADIGVFPGQAGTKETSTKREFAWGSADVWNGEHSDLGKLRESIFEINTRALKNHTRQVMYEKFRTERLLAHRARRGIPEGAESE